MKSKTYQMGTYDVIVVGAGHAGCEAALASARLGKKTLIIALNLESVAMMPCNPSIGGTGKGQLVREIDALGGEMGINIDKSFLQSKILNTAKGPAVHSLRAQADKHKYHTEMKKTLESTHNLDLRQGEVTELVLQDGKISGVRTRTNAIYDTKVVILATGTYLRGKVFIGNVTYEGGPNGLSASVPLADNLRELGLPLRRFKTGTPARCMGSSLDYSKMQEQKGDEKITPFSFMNDHLMKEQVSCWLTYTNETTHRIIMTNLEKSALYGGLIEGVGPRYCPSIEDKVNRFSDKERHQLFIEPEGGDTDEMYIQNMSTSMPEDIQHALYSSIVGLENIKIVRPAYAIEYDCINPLNLKLSLENRTIENLFCAGQFNGSSGYEEAAAQGLMAGINASLKIDGKDSFILDRSEAYIGVLLDDLITKGTTEPYRIMTSRAEYRLLLRQDNADIRLTEKAYKLGLASEKRYQRLRLKLKQVEAERERIASTWILPSKANAYLEELGHAPLNNKVTLEELIRRPHLTYDNLAAIDPERPDLPEHTTAQLEVQIKYQGYIDKQLVQISRFKKLESKRLDENLDYFGIDGLRLEAKQKLSEIKPISMGQASRISGVSPADINVLMIFLEKQRREAKS
jgi:tRNA uridine 5-carboxymethylaminomethyl modification enzyme